jgi:hypothetical protein
MGPGPPGGGGNRSRVGGKTAPSEKRPSPRFPSENRPLLASTRVRTRPLDLVLFWSPWSPLDFAFRGAACCPGTSPRGPNALLRGPRRRSPRPDAHAVARLCGHPSRWRSRAARGERWGSRRVSRPDTSDTSDAGLVASARARGERPCRTRRTRTSWCWGSGRASMPDTSTRPLWRALGPRREPPGRTGGPPSDMGLVVSAGASWCVGARGERP